MILCFKKTFCGPENIFSRLFATMSYGSVGSQSIRKTEAISDATSSARKAILIGMAAMTVCCLVSIDSFSRRTALASPVDGLELNAYLTGSQAEEFKKLVSEQTSIDAQMSSLLSREHSLPPEDTKVHVLPHPLRTFD